MKIAIHHKKGTFSERWIEYCERVGIPFKIVDAFRTDIVQEVQDCDIFMWHYIHSDFEDALAARKIIFALQHAGKKVFPDFNTHWHYDDKVGQKYLLEAVGAPLVPSYVFYNKKEAISWVQNTSFPKVFKLRGGAGSANVKLVKNSQEARRIIEKAFGRGFKQFDGFSYFIDTFKKFRSGTKSLSQVGKAFGRMLISNEFSKKSGKERGYVYFQDFIPDNDSDIRVIIIGDKAFALKRMTMKNDFRASGSGLILYEKHHFDVETIKLAFKVNQKLQTQCCAMDFVYLKGEPKLVEISFGFKMNAYDKCVGYWDSELQFHEGSFNPQVWMVDLLIRSNGNLKQ